MHREERSSTAFKPMPHISTYGGSYFSTKANSYKLEADGFMKLGDIRGEFSPSREADGVSDQVAQFTTGGGGDSLTDAGLGNNRFNQPTNVWTNGSATSFNCDDILLGHGVGVNSQDDFLQKVNGTIGYDMQAGMDVSANARGNTTGTIAVLQIDTGSANSLFTDAGLGNNSFNQSADIWTNGGASTFKADVLTNYRPESFSEVEMHFATPLVDEPSKFELDKSSTKYNPGKGASFGTEQAEGWIIIESMVNQDNVQGLDAGGMNYAEAVGLDSSPLELINKIGGSAIPGGDDI